MDPQRLKRNRILGLRRKRYAGPPLNPALNSFCFLLFSLLSCIWTLSLIVHPSNFTRSIFGLCILLISLTPAGILFTPCAHAMIPLFTFSQIVEFTFPRPSRRFESFNLVPNQTKAWRLMISSAIAVEPGGRVAFPHRSFDVPPVLEYSDRSSSKEA